MMFSPPDTEEYLQSMYVQIEEKGEQDTIKLLVMINII